VKEGDTLPMLAYEVYGDSAYYLELARVNGLDDFRNLKAGDRIFFPPVESASQ
jgi:nucleoid-associated protein YgaU